ncbi:fas-associated death domain protein [Episyrphus balteatus]|uniref:fas-associated death domain protein n=1 Tax=Episyrphus balteatus TaxID=286459 RepID=UPI0024869BC1|nr:fas-associated death domain protein [Episyrphus balteatus]
MPETNHWSYDFLKSMITQKQVSQIDVENFKMLFKDEIQSTRRYACIKTLDDLLDCLERRDNLSEYNVDPFRSISEYFADDEIDMALEKYHPPTNDNDLQNIYALQRNQEKEKIAIKSELKEEPKVEHKPVVIIEFNQKKRDDIYKLIARDIGRDWRFFGRELSIRAGDLDKIDAKHPKDLHSKVYEVFEIFENDPSHNPREHYNIICEALDSCRRKDVRRLVQKVMSY